VLARLEPEGLTHALKHAGPTAIRVSLERAADAVAVEDRGPAPGRDPRPPSGGYGLGGMRTRVEDLGGRLSFGRTGPGGWRLQAEIPLAGSAKTDLSTGS
jgi:signal transduction histidine kinase